MNQIPQFLAQRPNREISAKFVIRLDAVTFSGAIEKNDVKQFYETSDQFMLAYSDKRKRTRGRYNLVTQHKWENAYTGLKNLSFLQKFSAHFRFCAESSIYTTGAELRAAIFNLFEHALGNHANCEPTCQRGKKEPWQNEQYEVQIRALEQFMRSKLSEKECNGIIKAGATAKIESYWAQKLLYLPKNVHFGLPACRARNECCRLDNNARHDPCPVCVTHGIGHDDPDQAAEHEQRYRAEWRELMAKMFLLVQPPAANTRSSSSR